MARDTSNNLATSTPVNLLVNNTPTTTPSTNNLVTNGNFETAGTGGNPVSWNRGGWGTNTRTFNYPVTGDTGNGAEVVVSGYSNGDAKWYFDPVAVVPNTEYSISNKYKSTINSEVLIRYTLTDGTFQYQFLSALANSNNTWQNFSQTVVAPANSTHLTVFHLIAGNGSLVLDNMNVTGASSTSLDPVDTAPPSVSVENPTNNSEVSETVTISANATDNVGIEEVALLINGQPYGSVDTTSPYSFTWDSKTVSNGTNTIAVVARDTSGNERTSDVVVVIVNNIITPPNTDNLVDNGDVETVGVDNSPVKWNRGGWGNNNRVLNYPVAGFSGNGIEVTINDYVDGDAKWYFDPIVIAGGAQYTISDQYKSTVDSEVLIRYTLTDGTFQYQFLSALANSNNTWQNFSQTVVVPVNATHMTLFHMIAQNGTLVIDNVSVK